MHTLRPRRTLGRNIGFSIAALVLPILATQLWVLDPTGAWAVVAWAGAVIAALLVFAWIAYQRTQATVSRYGIVERGFFGGTYTIRASDIATVLRVQLYRGSSLDTTQELFVVNRAGRGVFRMRGRFWNTSTMDRVAKILDVEETVRTEPVTLAELRETDPNLLYWFERRSLTR
ncbi:hypothetical protein [Agromyces aureus]|uniref:PH domain-containing protein n=1 Tax=Agromyces aureus TaxID=453304 RepID=A0A191WD96_9MICO|nr:hypothetical protein [Agromyces aureus]ANJ26231.1 hypothetical protein ATC03_05335 [Agromyces aureus]